MLSVRTHGMVVSGRKCTVLFQLTPEVRIHRARELELIPMGCKKEGNNRTSHRFPDLFANIPFCQDCCVPHVTPGVLVGNTVVRSIYLSLS